MSTEPETIAITREYIVDGAFAGRVAKAAIVYGSGRSAAPGIALLAYGFVGLLILLGGLIGQSSEAVFGGAVATCIFLILPVLGYLIVRRNTARSLPPGSRIALGLGESSMRTEGPLGSSVISYRAYRRAFIGGDLVVLKHRQTRATFFLPKELFGADDVTKLSDRIAQANS